MWPEGCIARHNIGPAVNGYMFFLYAEQFLNACPLQTKTLV